MYCTVNCVMFSLDILSNGRTVKQNGGGTVSFDQRKIIFEVVLEF
jgi:hypothetical protein